MTSPMISFKAHSKCVGDSGVGFFKPGVSSPVLKNNLFKTPYNNKQTPVHRRNVPRVQIEAVKTLKKFSSCQNLNVIQKDKPIAKCNKSKSYECLKSSHGAINHIPLYVSRKQIKNMDENDKVDVVGNRVIKEACTAFLLNAWRHRRREVADIKKNISSLENQTTDLRVQIMSLWQLLESEKARLAQANLKAMQQHVLAEDAIVNNKNLLTVNTNQQKEICELNKEVQSMRTECNNQKNELIVAKQEIFSLHNQLDKERVKVTKLREDKKILLDKVHSAEAEAKKKTALIIQNENEQKEKDEAHMAILQSLQDRNLLLDQLTSEKESMQTELNKKATDNEQLQLKITELEKTLKEKDEEIESLKIATEKYMIEAVQMRLATLQQQEKDENWVVNASRRLTASLIMALIPMVQKAAFP